MPENKIEIEDQTATLQPHPMVLALADQIDQMLLATAPPEAHMDIAGIVLATIAVHMKAPMAEIVKEVHSFVDKVLKFAKDEHKECVAQIQGQLGCPDSSPRALK